jgi:hypothetical protein
MENVTKWKTNLAVRKNNDDTKSYYILLPAKIRKYEGIDENSTIFVTIQKTSNEEYNKTN